MKLTTVADTDGNLVFQMCCVQAFSSFPFFCLLKALNRDVLLFCWVAYICYENVRKLFLATLILSLAFSSLKLLHLTPLIFCAMLVQVNELGFPLFKIILSCV